MNKIKIIFILLFVSNRFTCQNVEEAIKKTAIEYNDWTSSNQNIYNVLKNYKFICVGEMHGTNEPAEFLMGLAKTFISNNLKVIVGFEIPNNLMTEFQQQQDSIGLAKTDFFSVKSIDGRASKAWFNAINECNKLGAKFCFFDNANSNRDLGMYEKLLESYHSDTSFIILTISGNIHNKIAPYNNSKTMGCYLKENFGNKVCSINHLYNGGTMYNRTSKGLKIHTVQPTNGIFSTATNYKGYYLPNIFNINDYSAFFFTKTVTASLPRIK